MEYPEYYPDFFTATILEWKPLLQLTVCKEIIINSLKFLSTENKITVFGFVIMPNHLHVIWQISNHIDKIKLQQSFKKYTAQMMLGSAGRPPPTGAGGSVADSASSTSAHGIRPVSCASGWRRSICESRRERNNSSARASPFSDAVSPRRIPRSGIARKPMRT